MQELFKILIGIGVLILGFPIGILLAKFTKEELQKGKFWFILIIILSLIGAIIGLILANDVLLFSMLFFAVVTSMSLKKDKKGRIKYTKKQ